MGNALGDLSIDFSNKEPYAAWQCDDVLAAYAKYQLPQAFGPQPDSKKSRAATPGFGASTRDQRSKVFISLEHGKDAYGTQSTNKWYNLPSAVGKQVRHLPRSPCDLPTRMYLTSQLFGKQVSSRMDTRPRSAFSRSSRWAAYEAELRRNTVPGPGSYDF